MEKAEPHVKDNPRQCQPAAPVLPHKQPNRGNHRQQFRDLDPHSVAMTSSQLRKMVHESNPTNKQEAQIAKWVSLIVKLGALIFILFVPTKFAIQLQLLGGIWIIQTLPAVLLGTYTRWFNSWALFRSCPNGFSTTIRWRPRSRLTPARSRLITTSPKSAGLIAR